MTAEALSQLTNQNSTGLTINYFLDVHVDKVEAQTVNLLGDLQRSLQSHNIPNYSSAAFRPPVPEAPTTNETSS